MDPSIRRDIWNLILRKKQNCVTVMTTHSMEEADILGDNIAIMAGGQLRSVRATRRVCPDSTTDGETDAL